MVLSFKINDCKETNLSNIPVHCIIKNKAVNEISLTTLTFDLSFLVTPCVSCHILDYRTS